jgi:ABC-2 type transport system ATP-binding protein
LAEGPPSTLAGRDTADTFIRFRVPEGATDPPPELGASRTEGTMEIRTDDPTRVLHQLTGWALGVGIRLEGLAVTRPSLEDVYLEITRSTDRAGASHE